MEMYFYVFVSLPLLAFYRDWTVLAAMSAGGRIGDQFRARHLLAAVDLRIARGQPACGFWNTR